MRRPDSGSRPGVLNLGFHGLLKAYLWAFTPVLWTLTLPSSLDLTVVFQDALYCPSSGTMEASP